MVQTMMLIKDTKTGSKSITITCLVITFLLTAASCIINLVILAKGGEPQTSMIWSCLGFCVPFVALYWNKRLKASVTGIEIGSDEEKDV